MYYHHRSSTQQALKVSQKVNSKYLINTESQNVNISYSRNLKKPTKINNSNVFQNQKQRYSIDSNNRCKTPQIKKQIIQKQKTSKNRYESIQTYIKETDNSMQEILNSSINQFEKLMTQEDSQNQALEQQNSRLKTTLSKMKNILKDKLETALKKQKQQLSKMLQDYISLITKLLKDKQELTLKLQSIQMENQIKINETNQYWSEKYEEMIKDKQQYIQGTKKQLDQFLSIIEQYQEETKMENTRIIDMKSKIQLLQKQKMEMQRKLNQKNEDSNLVNMNQSKLLLKIQVQSSKIQTLLELLEKSEVQKSDLKSQLSRIKSKQSSRVTDTMDIKGQYEKLISSIEQQHQQQFLQYQKAIKDTIVKKDQCIQRLNYIIEGLRQRKANHQNLL